MEKNEFIIYTFYRFKTISNLKSIKTKLSRKKDNNGIYGTILISFEGLNGTISGNKKELDEFIIKIKRVLRIRKLLIKVSKNNFIPFNRFKIRIKKEIVTIGNKSIAPEKATGKYILPKNWDQTVKNKKFLVIDTRNEYEIKIGSFKNAVNPKTKSFREFPKFIKKSNINKNQQIAMFCTGGIRCEKASSYLLMNGYKNVYQLDGGILNYLEYKKNKQNNTWRGECFVFDNRVAVNKKLEKGNYIQCFGCRTPLAEKDLKSKYYEKGVKCSYCHNKRSDKQINSSKMRQKQITLSKVIFSNKIK